MDVPEVSLDDKEDPVSGTSDWGSEERLEDTRPGTFEELEE